MNKLKHLSDEELVAGAIENHEYFAELFERYEATLLRYIKRISSFSDERAQEILQDVFIRIWKNINSFDPQYKFSSWAYRIAHNVSINTWKKEHKHIKNVYVGELDIENLATDNDILQSIDGEEQKIAMSRAIEKLPLKYKDILILRYWEDKNYQEISDILKKPINTIGTLIRRSKKALKEILEEEGNI